MEYYRNEFGIMRPVSEQVKKVDPILGTPVIKNTGYQPQFQDKKTLPKQKKNQSGLGNNDILADYQRVQKYNEDNKYRVNGVNISNRVGDYVSDVVKQLFK